VSSVLAILTLLGLVCLAWSMFVGTGEPEAERPLPRPDAFESPPDPTHDQPPVPSSSRDHGPCAQLRREIELSLATAVATGNPTAAYRGLDAIRRLRLADPAPALLHDGPEDCPVDTAEAALRDVLAGYEGRNISP
jgi:hypothetical protein